MRRVRCVNSRLIVALASTNTSSSPEHKPKLTAECQAVVLTYACDRPSTLEWLRSGSLSFGDSSFTTATTILDSGGDQGRGAGCRLPQGEGEPGLRAQAIEAQALRQDSGRAVEQNKNEGMFSHAVFFLAFGAVLTM
ncbi:unnamed protein product [Urochloa humidicola]